jgi:N-acetylglucosaminyl-diphospho-decaprenol L-rhamnosyltransferase
MSISRQNLSIVIVTLKSENVIHQCIESIDKEIPIIIVENSDNQIFKKDLEEKYINVKCILSNKNLGMGSGNNLGIKNCKSDFIFILNPDVVLEKNAIDELILASKKHSDFTVLSPLASKIDYPNYQIDKNKMKVENDLPFKVKSVDGFAMLFNKKNLDKIIRQETFNTNQSYFDENFFMYLENDDLCKRIIESGNDILVVPNAKINHLGAKAVDDKYFEQVELSRNWHWIWSKFYFNKKHNGFMYAFINGFAKFLQSIIKFFFYYLINNKYKQKIYFNRASGFYNSFIGKSSWYRPKL